MLEQVVTVESPVNLKHVTATFVVDTGASYTLLPQHDVNHLQLEPVAVATVATAAGVVRMKVYSVRILASGETVNALAMVNPGGVRVLGLDAIRKIGLVVHPSGGN